MSCVPLRNALTCLCGNSTSSFFELDPPTLEEYFSWTILSHLSTNCWPKIELWNQLKVVKQRFDNSSIFSKIKESNTLLTVKYYSSTILIEETKLPRKQDEGYNYAHCYYKGSVVSGSPISIDKHKYIAVASYFERKLQSL